MTVSAWLRETEIRLSRAGIDAANLEAQLLAAHVLLVDRAWLAAHGDDEFPELAGEAIVQRREASEPLAYILGWREFYGRRYAVRPGVLIPRHETETLVEAALSLPNEAMTVLDLGTGSGCLAVTLKLERPAWKVIGSDISSVALEIAESNGTALAADVEWLLSDAFEALAGRTFDLIVANPPYIAESERLPREVADFEPKQALVSGPTGLEFYARLASEAGPHLASQGMLAVEVGHRQAVGVGRIFADAAWGVESPKRDLSGIERVVVVRKP